jgi:hypothetical protein
MGKHLSINEKLNAQNELIKNRKEILYLRKEIKDLVNNIKKEELVLKIQTLKNRNKKLKNHILYSKKSVHNGKYGINGICYNLFGKKTCELNKEELSIYNKIMKERSRKKCGNVYDKEYYHKYYLEHKEQLLKKSKIWREKNPEKIKEINKKRKLKREKERGYASHQGNWTFKTFGKRYKDMTEEEKKIRQKIYKQMRKINENC